MKPSRPGVFLCFPGIRKVPDHINPVSGLGRTQSWAAVSSRTSLLPIHFSFWGLALQGPKPKWRELPKAHRHLGLLMCPAAWEGCPKHCAAYQPLPVLTWRGPGVQWGGGGAGSSCQVRAYCSRFPASPRSCSEIPHWSMTYSLSDALKHMRFYSAQLFLFSSVGQLSWTT